MWGARYGHSWRTPHGGRSWVTVPLWWLPLGWLGSLAWWLAVGWWLWLLLAGMWLAVQLLLLAASLAVLAYGEYCARHGLQVRYRWEGLPLGWFVLTLKK